MVFAVRLRSSQTLVQPILQTFAHEHQFTSGDLLHYVYASVLRGMVGLLTLLYLYVVVEEFSAALTGRPPSSAPSRWQWLLLGLVAPTAYGCLGGKGRPFGFGRSRPPEKFEDVGCTLIKKGRATGSRFHEWSICMKEG